MWQAFGPAGTVSLSCSKTGELDDPGMRAGTTCDDPMWSAVGIWPLVMLGTLLCAAPALAALIMRWWASCLATAVLAGLTVLGLSNWTGFWGLLMFGGVPMTAAAIGISAFHLRVKHCNAVAQPSDRPRTAG
ncbi:hypothetical protein GDN83_15330 [Gordonia jinghuaiqii]|uniref:Uncharacterized protein n=1 Tax=Gordonia jinghuaiqii TaxID=2758710 RepID=A0A7D7LVJ4_9ACTN|nr:hypothetical protein [Gordonia jinghuaiqii]MCR5979085.1 hypothetical protein [Gordonia jinghuaiqii]QMT01595.1 hypothetical protein H1R19_22775 [Gordonia jinghuaiqii]